MTSPSENIYCDSEARNIVSKSSSIAQFMV